MAADRYNALTAWLLALGGENLSRLSSSGIVSSVAQPGAIEDAAVEQGRSIPLFMAVGLKHNDSLKTATRKINASALRLVIESFSTASLPILARAGTLIMGSEEAGTQLAGKIWRDTLPMGVAREAFDTVWEHLTKVRAQDSVSLAKAAQSMSMLVDSLLAANPNNRDAIAAKAILGEPLVPSVPEAAFLWPRGVFISPVYAPTAGPKGDGLDTPSLGWAIGAFGSAEAIAADKSADSGVRLGYEVTTTNAACAVVLAWAGFRNSGQYTPVGATLYRTLHDGKPTVSHRGIDYGGAAALVGQHGAIFLPDLASALQRKLEQAFMLVGSAETETTSVPGALSMFRLVEKAETEASPVNFSSLIELRQSMQQLKEAGGMEEGFFPLIAAALPLFSSLLSGMSGGGSGQGAGGGGSGFKLPGMELISGLLGGGGGGAGGGGGGGGSGLMGSISSLLNPVGMIKTIAGLFGRRGKRKGGLEQGHDVLPLLDSMIHESRETGGRRKKKKKKKRAAPSEAVETEDSEDMAAMGDDVESLKRELRLLKRKVASQGQDIDDIDGEDIPAVAIPGDEGRELNALADSTLAR